MERVDIEIPVSVLDKVYRTNSNCNIQEGVITEIQVIATYYRSDDSRLDKTNVKINVKWGYCDNSVYNLEDLDNNVYLSKKDLIKHLVSNI